MNLALLIITVFLLLICIIFLISITIGNFETHLVNRGKIIFITETADMPPYKPNSGYMEKVSINNFKTGDNCYTKVYKDKNTFPISSTITL